ncbi:MAG TPA: hypothetical protein VFR04_08935 [Solirubrobacterales bacterium]|nr:hypothetical protein [Solirubrobacterales bacterium]
MKLIVLAGCLLAFAGCFLVGRAIWGGEEHPSRIRVTGLAREPIPAMSFHPPRSPDASEQPVETEGPETQELPPEPAPVIEGPDEGGGQGGAGGGGGGGGGKGGGPVIEE